MNGILFSQIIHAPSLSLLSLSYSLPLLIPKWKIILFRISIDSFFSRLPTFCPVEKKVLVVAATLEEASGGKKKERKDYHYGDCRLLLSFFLSFFCFLFVFSLSLLLPSEEQWYLNKEDIERNEISKLSLICITRSCERKKKRVHFLYFFDIFSVCDTKDDTVCEIIFAREKKTKENSSLELNLLFLLSNEKEKT